jgi:putative ribosome biogenesis GTPase RsgA
VSYPDITRRIGSLIIFIQPVVIVGNKMDLVNEREVDASMISDLASRWKVSVFETSAKRDWHVTDAFEGKRSMVFHTQRD